MKLKDMNKLEHDLDLLEKIYSSLEHFNKPFAFGSKTAYGAPKGVYFGIKKLYTFLKLRITKEAIETEQHETSGDVVIGPTEFETNEVIKRIADLREQTLIFLMEGIDEIYNEVTKKHKDVVDLME